MNRLKIVLLFFCILLLFFVFRNNKLPSLASASIQISLISLFLYLIYYVKTYLNLVRFYKNIKNQNKKPGPDE